MTDKNALEYVSIAIGATPDGNGNITFSPYGAKNYVLTLTANSKEVVRLNEEGRIWWNGREVETDDDFRAMVLWWAYNRSIGGL